MSFRDMTPTDTSTASPTFSSSKSLPARFDHEKLDVYQLELSFVGWVTDLLEETRGKSMVNLGEVRDQLDRASLSALLNTAEASGKRQARVRAKFFDDARGSATECAACLDAFVAKRTVPPERVQQGKEMLLRIVAMLTRLVARFSAADGLHEAPVDYRAVPVEDENENEEVGNPQDEGRNDE